MNQTRTFLLLALAFVAYLLFTAWMHEFQRPPTVPATSGSVAAATTAATPSVASVAAASSAARVARTGQASGTAALSAVTTATPPAHGKLIKVTTNVLALTIDSRGGTIVSAHLLKYAKKLNSKARVRLLNDTSARFYEAQSGLVGVKGDSAPNHKTLFHAKRTSYALAPGQKQITVALDWTNPASGVKVVKRYTLTRGSYAIKLTQTIENNGSKPWQGEAYRQFERVVPPKAHVSLLKKYAGSGDYGFFGAAWYGPADKFNKIKFQDIKKHPLGKNGGIGRQVKGGWIAMEQTYFVSAWLPERNQTSTFSTAVLDGAGKHAKAHFLIRSIGPLMTVAPGQSASSSARLFVGPKIPSVLTKVEPSFHLALNYGMMTIIARPLHWVLAKLHSFTGNWGWAIVLLVLLINACIYKLSVIQYRSSARMVKLKPRMDALKERFGDDKQKLQQATMALYKEEKVNPVAGCLPMLVILPIWFALYELLRESVGLRQAPFIFWLHDLSAPGPYYILPIIYAILMLIQMRMVPMMPTGVGASGTQQKLMRYMPVAFAVFYAFYPSGLSLYYDVNLLCRLGTMWHVYRKVDREHERKELARAKAKSGPESGIDSGPESEPGPQLKLESKPKPGPKSKSKSRPKSKSKPRS